MSIRRWLGLAGPGPERSTGDTETVRRIVEQLDQLEPERARFVAAFAYVLGRVAWADRDWSTEERDRMEELMREIGLSPEQAVLVVQMAKGQNQLFGGTENFLVTREFREIASAEERRRLLDALFRISAADSTISSTEEAQIRQIASELGFSHAQYVEARGRYSQHRSVLRRFEDRGEPG